VSDSGGQKPQFWANFDFLGAPIPTPFTDEGQIWCAVADPRYTLTCQISYRSVYSVALCWRKTPILPFFGLQHLLLSQTGSSLRKLDTGTQLQTFPYPTVSKSFPYSNAFMAKSGAQSLAFKSVTNKQTDRQKTQRFWPPRRRVKSEPHQTWHSARGLRARSCSSKTFGGLTHSFAARGR